MRTIVVDDEQLMLKRFVRLSKGIADLNLVGQFECAADAVAYARENPVELAFLDVAMPIVSGVELAQQLREIRPDMMIVFVTAYDNYIWDFNQIGGDYYILKPYSKEVLEMAMDRIRLLARRQHKELYIQTFGRFVVLKDGEPLPLRGKTKEILALVVTKRGREVSNEEIYNTIWEGREYGSQSMNVFHIALHRLKQVLKNAGCERLLISTPRGQMVNTDLFDCDYYAWQDQNMDRRDRFDGEFMSEYSWGEAYLADMLGHSAE